jgi:hypothetical protein
VKESPFNVNRVGNSRVSCMKFDRNRLSVIVVSALPLLVGAALAAMVLDSDVMSEIISHSAQPFTILDIILQAIVSTGLGSVVVLALFWIIRTQGPKAKKSIVAFIVSPILTVSFFILGQSLLLILFSDTTTSILPSLLSIATLGVLFMSFVFILIDSVPRSLRNFFVAFYGSVFGTFLGVIFLTTSMFVLIVSIVAEDYFLTRYSPVKESIELSDRVGSDPFEYAMIQSATGAVGVGDYIVFSLISAHSLLFFPIYVWIMSLLLALLGIIINVTVIARENQLHPGIPLPALLALFPWVLHLIMMIMLGA